VSYDPVRGEWGQIRGRSGADHRQVKCRMILCAELGAAQVHSIRSGAIKSTRRKEPTPSSNHGVRQSQNHLNT